MTATTEFVVPEIDANDFVGHCFLYRVEMLGDALVALPADQRVSTGKRGTEYLRQVGGCTR